MTSDPTPSSPDHPAAEPGTAGLPPQPEPAKPQLKFTRVAALWSALIAGFLVLIVLLIFIIQNSEPWVIQFLAWRWSLPVGVSILLAAVCGGLLTVAVGSARMIQLRRAAKKNLAPSGPGDRS